MEHLIQPLQDVKMPERYVSLLLKWCAEDKYIHWKGKEILWKLSEKYVCGMWAMPVRIVKESFTPSHPPMTSCGTFTGRSHQMWNRGVHFICSAIPCDAPATRNPVPFSSAFLKKVLYAKLNFLRLCSPYNPLYDACRWAHSAGNAHS